MQPVQKIVFIFEVRVLNERKGAFMNKDG